MRVAVRNLLLALRFASAVIILPATAQQSGRVAEASGARPPILLPGDARHTLWLARNHAPRDNRLDVIVNFHGSPRTLRECVRLAGLDCVVISVNYGGLSSVYRRPFSGDRQLLAKILDEALAELRKQEDVPDDVEWGRVAITSFSAGFGAVREILKSPEYFERIEAIYMVDSLYCGYIGDGTDDVQQGIVHPGLMKDFLRFAEASAAGEKTMIVTHCDGPTPGYASTRETADYLLEKIDLQPESTDEVVRLPAGASFPAEELQLYRRAARKGFHLYGSPGGNETDHVKHLLHMAHWLPKLPLAKRVAVASEE